MALPTKPVETSAWLYHQFAKYPTDAADISEITARRNANRKSYSVLRKRELMWTKLRTELYLTKRTVGSSVGEAYIELLCDFHNRRTQVAEISSVPLYIAMETDFMQTLRSARATWDVPGLGGLTKGTRHLVEHPSMPAGVTKRVISDNLDKIEHIFVPLDRSYQGHISNFPGGDHGALIIISPNNKTVEYFDGLQLDDYDHYVNAVFDWLMYEFSAKSFNANGQSSFDISEWYWRANKCHNQTVLGRSTVNVDCGVHVCINAYNVAFGHPTAPEGNQIGYEEVKYKRTRLMIELAREELSIERLHGIDSVPMMKDEYTGKIKTYAGKWRQDNDLVEIDQETGRRRPPGPGWARLTWFDKCKWADKWGREVRGSGFEYTMARRGKSDRSIPGAVFNLAVEEDRKVLRDIADELEIPEATQMVCNVRGPTRWTRAMIRQRIDYERMQRENYHYTQWALITEKHEKQPKPPKRVPVAPPTPKVSPFRLLNGQTQTQTQRGASPTPATPKRGDAANNVINLVTPPRPVRPSTPTAPRRNPTYAQPSRLPRPARPQMWVQQGLTPPAVTDSPGDAPFFDDDAPDPTPTRQPRPQASRAVTPPPPPPKKRPRSVFEGMGETIVNSAIFKAISPIRKKRPKPNPSTRPPRAAATKAAARIRMQTAQARRSGVVKKEEKEE